MEKKWFKTDFIWDLETFPNCFTACFVYANGQGIRVFEISDRKNETEGLLEFLRKVKVGDYRLVGFNSVGFDYPILHHILTKAKKAFKKGEPVKLTAKELYKVAMDLINAQDDEKFGKMIKQDDVIIRQVDLYKIHHFDNRAKATSLKVLEFNMRSKNIEDLPFPVGTILDDKQKDTLIKYNKHDVMETLKFYWYSYDALKLRDELSIQFGFDCTNYNDTKIGSELFINSLEKAQKGLCYIQSDRGRKMRQTKRDRIVIKDCLFDYLKFKRPEFQAVHNWFKSQVITETKGAFSDYLEHQLGDVAKYAEMVVKKKKLSDPIDKKNKRYVPSEDLIEVLKKEQPLGWIEEKELKSPKGAISYYWCYNVVETINVIIDGLRFDFGTGGIHASLSSVTVSSDDDYQIIDADVASMYPNISISNNAHPEHLGLTFCKVYKHLYEERKKYPKGSGANAAIKLALNGVYGKSNSEYSPFFDPAYTMKITINGQLSLCMLAEMYLEIGCKLIQCNTDGVTALVPKDKVEDYYRVSKEWEQIVKLDLEYAEYSKMYLSDVNNYLAVYMDGKVKSKGRYEVAHFEKLGWSKNHSAMIIPIAALKYLTEGEDFRQTIFNHEDPFDMMLRVKVPRNSRLVLTDSEGNDTPQQNICRYYPCEDGGDMIKIMPPLEGKEEAGERRMSIESDWKVATCNDMADFKWKNVNYSYYINEARKLIEGVGAEVPEWEG